MGWGCNILRKIQTAIFCLILAIICIFSVESALAGMTSTNYQIQWDEVSPGGGSASSSSYGVRDSIGSSSANSSLSSASYAINPGFRAGVYDQVVSFVPYVQDRSTQVAAVSAVIGPLTSVTVTTTSGFSVGDYVLIVQNEGASQVTAMGHVTSVTATTLGIRSNYAGSDPVIDGSNDSVYRMSTTMTMGFGTLSSATVETHSVGWVATADIDDGYSVYMFSDGNLRAGAESIPGVADGEVTAGASEYGGRSSDTTLVSSTFDTQDTAFTTDPALVASATGHPFSSLGFVTLKASISEAQAGGSYAQTLTAVFVGEY